MNQRSASDRSKNANPPSETKPRKQGSASDTASSRKPTVVLSPINRSFDDADSPPETKPSKQGSAPSRKPTIVLSPINKSTDDSVRPLKTKARSNKQDVTSGRASSRKLRAVVSPNKTTIEDDEPTSPPKTKASPSKQDVTSDRASSRKPRIVYSPINRESDYSLKTKAMPKSTSTPIKPAAKSMQSPSLMTPTTKTSRSDKPAMSSSSRMTPTTKTSRLDKPAMPSSSLMTPSTKTSRSSKLKPLMTPASVKALRSDKPATKSKRMARSRSVRSKSRKIGSSSKKPKKLRSRKSSRTVKALSRTGRVLTPSGKSMRTPHHKVYFYQNHNLFYFNNFQISSDPARWIKLNRHFLIFESQRPLEYYNLIVQEKQRRIGIKINRVLRIRKVTDEWSNQVLYGDMVVAVNGIPVNQ